jgi:hypothetical protein
MAVNIGMIAANIHLISTGGLPHLKSYGTSRSERAGPAHGGTRATAASVLQGSCRASSRNGSSDGHGSRSQHSVRGLGFTDATWISQTCRDAARCNA